MAILRRKSKFCKLSLNFKVKVDINENEIPGSKSKFWEVKRLSVQTSLVVFPCCIDQISTWHRNIKIISFIVFHIFHITHCVHVAGSTRANLHALEQPLGQICRGALHTLHWRASGFGRIQEIEWVLIWRDNNDCKTTIMRCSLESTSNRRPPGGPPGSRTSRSRCSPAASSCWCSCTQSKLQKITIIFVTIVIIIRDALIKIFTKIVWVLAF